MPVPLRWIAARCISPLVAFALVTFAAPSMAQRTPATLTGTVVDAQTGQGIAAVLVEVSPGGRHAVTDAEGRFQFRLRAGDYLVRASQVGYGEQEQVASVDAAVPAALVFSLEPQPIVLERLHVVLDRFAARRNSVAMSSRVLDRRQLARAGGHNLVQVVASASVPLAPCGGAVSLSMLFTGSAGTQCVYSRGEVVRPAVYIDDQPAFGGMDELALFTPLDTHHVEIYGTGRMIRVYTMQYVEAVATGRRSLHTFANWRCPGCP